MKPNRRHVPEMALCLALNSRRRPKLRLRLLTTSSSFHSCEFGVREARFTPESLHHREHLGIVKQLAVRQSPSNAAVTRRGECERRWTLTSRVIRRSLNGEGIPRSHRPGSKPVSRVPGTFTRRCVSESPPRRKQVPQGQLDASRKSRCSSIAFVRDDDGGRLPGMLLKPFRSRPAHIMLLWPIAVRQVPHVYPSIV